MRKKISEMTEADKFEFLEKTKQVLMRNYGISWEAMEAKIASELENIFDDKKFVKMDPDSRIDAAYTRKEFGNRKPEIVDYLLWMHKFTTHSEYAEW